MTSPWRASIECKPMSQAADHLPGDGVVVMRQHRENDAQRLLQRLLAAMVLNSGIGIFLAFE